MGITLTNMGVAEMTKLVPRDAKHEEAFMDAVWSALKADTSDLGKQQRILAAFRAIPVIDPAAIREEKA